MTQLLSQSDLDEALGGDLSAWSQEGATLVRAIRAPSFLGGIDLVRAVAEAAEELNHHPDIDVRWTTVTFRLSTHSAGGLTAADLLLARRIEDLAPA